MDLQNKQLESFIANLYRKATLFDFINYYQQVYGATVLNDMTNKMHKTKTLELANQYLIFKENEKSNFFEIADEIRNALFLKGNGVYNIINIMSMYKLSLLEDEKEKNKYNLVIVNFDLDEEKLLNEISKDVYLTLNGDVSKQIKLNFSNFPHKFIIEIINKSDIHIQEYKEKVLYRESFRNINSFREHIYTINVFGLELETNVDYRNKEMIFIIQNKKNVVYKFKYNKVDEYKLKVLKRGYLLANDEKLSYVNFLQDVINFEFIPLIINEKEVKSVDDLLLNYKKYGLQQNKNKYRIMYENKDSMVINDKSLYRIQALIDVNPNVLKGDIGGFVEGENNLSQKNICWIYDDAKVYDYSQVLEQAIVKDNSQVSGTSVITNKSIIMDDAKVSGYANIGNKANIKDQAHVTDKATIKGDAIIEGSSIVGGSVLIKGNVKVKIEDEKKLMYGTFKGKGIVTSGYQTKL